MRSEGGASAGSSPGVARSEPRSNRSFWMRASSRSSLGIEPVCSRAMPMKLLASSTVPKDSTRRSALERRGPPHEAGRAGVAGLGVDLVELDHCRSAASRCGRLAQGGGRCPRIAARWSARAAEDGEGGEDRDNGDELGDDAGAHQHLTGVGAAALNMFRRPMNRMRVTTARATMVMMEVISVFSRDSGAAPRSARHTWHERAGW